MIRPLDLGIADEAAAPSDGTLRFGVPAWMRLGGRLCALTAAAAAAYALFAPDLEGRMHALLLIGAGVLFAAGVLEALWDEGVEVDPRAGRYRHIRGFAPFRREQIGSLVDFPRLVLHVRERRNAYGQVDRRYTLRLEDPWRSLTLFRNWEEGLAPALAARLAEALGRPLETETQVYETSSRTSRTVTLAVTWGAMVLVFIVMLWPVLSGQRPLIDLQRPTLFGMPKQDPSLLNLGLQYYYQRRYVEAEDTFRKALTERPDNSEAYNMLAYSVAEQGRLDEALAFAQRALSFAPNDGNIIDTVGEMHERRREWREAARYYALALQHLPDGNTTETHAKYGRTLLALHRKSEAIVHLRQAAHGIYSPWGQMAMRLLQQLDPGVNRLGPPRSRRPI